MTELVTSTTKVAQDVQQGLVAQRPQGQSPERQHAPVQIAESSVEPDVRRAPSQPGSADRQSDENEAGRREARRQAELTGPSRPRVELRQFDLGRTPAEVVGTRDVVLRFDANNDGRIDLIESQRANRARAETGSFAGLYSGADAPPLPERGVAQIDARTSSAASAASKTAKQAPQQPGSADTVNTAPKIAFGEGRTQAEVEVKKFGDKALAEQGVGSGEREVAQKYYGRGAEVVVGQFASPQEQPVKYSDRVAENDRGKLSEEGSGERKFYDKVAQAEPQFSGENGAQQQQSYFERAQSVADQRGDGSEPGREAKKYYAQNESGAPTTETKQKNTAVSLQTTHVTVTA